MKKLLTLFVACLMAVSMIFSFGCSEDEQLAMGKEMVKYKSQLDAVRQLNNGTVHAVVIDSVMAGWYASNGDYAGKIAIVPDLILAEEEYGIAAKKGNLSIMQKINEALIALNANGEMATIAQTFGLQDTLSITSNTTNPITDDMVSDTAWQDILNSNNKKLVVGITIFAPIAYYKTNDNQDPSNLTGFDIELAKAAVDYLNTAYSTSIQIEFTTIEWSAKEGLLDNGSIHLVWNGMTITPDRQENMCISVPYLYNRQVAVVKTENVNKYSTKSSFKNAVIGVEAGSAGESVVTGK